MGEVIKTYYDTGQLRSEVFVIDGKENGESKYYHKNGQLKLIQFYIDGKIKW